MKQAKQFPDVTLLAFHLDGGCSKGHEQSGQLMKFMFKSLMMKLLDRVVNIRLVRMGCV